MSRHPLTVTPRTSLFIGGYSAADGQSSGDTAHDGSGLLIPGSVIKGALRESALRLVRGAGLDEAVLVTLFGDEFQLRAGKLRIGQLRAAGEGAGWEPSVRHHVSIERARRQAADRRLFQNRVTPAGHGLRFEGELTLLETLTEDEYDLLRAAVAITDQIGGGRGRGLGLVAVEIGEASRAEEGGNEVGARVEGVEGTEMVLVLEALEPIQLGGVKDPGNIEHTHEVLAGSVVRGAAAAVLARRVAAEKRDAVLELVFGGAAPAIFGDGLPGGESALPAPRTLEVPKTGGAPVDRAVALCQELLAGGSAAGARQDVRAAAGVWSKGDRGWRRCLVSRRLVTRAARNPIDGRGSSGQLFSVEVLDPAPDDGGGQPLRFYVPLRGTAEQLGWVIWAARQGLLVGGTRSRGFGRVELVEVLRPRLAPLEDRHVEWRAALTERGTPAERARSTGVILALGPLALNQPRLDAALAGHGLKILGGDARRRAYGGWNSRRKLPRTVVGCYQPGAVFIVATRDGSSALKALEALEDEGLGPGRADGWGRLVACHPIHLDCCERSIR